MSNRKQIYISKIEKLLRDIYFICDDGELTDYYIVDEKTWEEAKIELEKIIDMVNSVGDE